MSEHEHHEQDKKSPEYWDGHTRSDGCPLDHRVGDFDQHAISFAQKTLDDFLAMKNKEPRPLDNEVFKTSDYPPGTVISFNSEEFYEPYPKGVFPTTSWGGEPFFTKMDHQVETFFNYGVVAPVGEEQKERTIVRFSIDTNSIPKQIKVPEALFSELKIGKVYHLTEQHLMRFFDMRLLALGGGIPVKHNSQKSSLFGRLLPKPLRG